MILIMYACINVKKCLDYSACMCGIRLNLIFSKLYTNGGCGKNTKLIWRKAICPINMCFNLLKFHQEIFDPVIK